MNSKIRRSRRVRRVINQFPPGIRLILIIALVIGPAFVAWLLGADLPLASNQTDNPTSTESSTLKGIASVIDGDTLDMHGQRIRLHGIDAPESKQSCTRHREVWRCGQEAALALSDKIARRPIDCEKRDIDRYKRIVAICRLNGEDLNAWSVRSGWAMAYRQYSKDYVADEDFARAASAGIWSGSVQAPWEWRRKPQSE